MKKSKILVLMLACLTLSLGSVYAGPEHKKHSGHSMMGGKMIKKMLHHLDLTDEQKSQIKAIKQEIKAERSAMKAVKANRVEAHKAYMQLVLQEQFDPAAVEQHVAQSLSHKKARMVEQAKNLHRILSVLTPEQKEQLMQKLEKKMAKRAKKHH